jgi:hypothetical protein
MAFWALLLACLHRDQIPLINPIGVRSWQYYARASFVRYKEQSSLTPCCASDILEQVSMLNK